VAGLFTKDLLTANHNTSATSLENLLVPYRAVNTITGSSALVLAPHPDDEVFGCGGAIMRHVEHDTPVRVIIVTDGVYNADQAEQSNYLDQRRHESISAAAILGYGTPVFWSYHDRDLRYGEKLIAEIQSAIHNTDADLVYAPSVYEIHPDHRALGMAALEAIRRSKQSIQLALYEVGQPLRPNLLLDISDLAVRKKKAMSCFTSQNAKQRYDLDIAALNRYRTYTLPAEITAAEAYILTNTTELAEDPLQLYRSEHARQQKIGLTLDSNDLPLVSVIIRSMDRPTLSEALDSVALQTYTNIEVIVINAKGDAHRELKTWCGRFPLIFSSNTEPLHRSQAANLGLETAQGKYLIFLDDDDFFYPEHINTLITALQNQRKAQCVYSGIRVEHYIDNKLDQVTEFNEAYNPHKLLSRNFIPIHAMLFEKSLFSSEQCAFDENLEVFEDWDFWIQISQCCEIKHTGKITAVYRNHGDSGLGTELDKNFLHQSRSKVYEKWKSRLTGEQLEDMVQYWDNKTTDLDKQLIVKTDQITTLHRRINHLEQSTQKTIIEFRAEIDRLKYIIEGFKQSSSWRITAPLRFLSRIIRGQHGEAWSGIRRKILPLVKIIYRIFPARFRHRLVPIIYRLTGSFFANTEHYEYWRAKQSHQHDSPLFQANTTLTGLTDIADISPLATTPGSIAIHAHIFYADLVKEFAKFLKNMPYPYDLFVSTSNEASTQICQQALSDLPMLNELTITLVPNRGRDIAPLFCTFGDKLQQYDFIGHIHSKKSLYSNGAADGWREYLLNHLLGSPLQIQRIFSLLTSDKKVGFIYPQNSPVLPYWGNTWLSNKANGTLWCKKLGITNIPMGYFDFPAGSMFWAKTKALQPLFDARFKTEDFPEETGQNDATLAHCIERLFVLITRRSGFNATILKDMKTLSWSRWRIDRYLMNQKEKTQATLQHPSVRVVVFDIFDTLLTRPLLDPETIRKIIARNADNMKLGERYLELRKTAEHQARQTAGHDVGLDLIFKELAALSGLSMDDTEQLRQLEETIESSIISPRPETVELFRLAISLGKRVILASDMYLPKPVIETMLTNCGIAGWHAFYLSSDNGLRKDTGEFYRQLLIDEDVTPPEVLIIGDNEHSDAQKPDDLKFKIAHVMRPVELARASPRFETIIENAMSQDLNTQLTIGLIVQTNFRPLFYPNFDPTDFVPASPWAVGFTVVGPLVLSFVQWLAKIAKADAIRRLYFLAREGEILKIVYDSWTSNTTHAVPSEYLVLSRRAITVPMISNLDDIFKIARTHYAPNPMPDFILERFGISLSDQECEEISRRNIWPKKKMVSVEEEDINALKPLLQSLEKRILNQAEKERPGLLEYLSNLGLNSETDAAIVDVGYAATTQGHLNRLLEQKIHGYYLMTLDRAKQVASAHQVNARGYYCHYAKPSATEPAVYRKSFTIEKLLSADTAQIVRYHVTDPGDITPEHRTQTDEEQKSAATRAEIRRGILDFTNQAITIRDKLLSDFEIPPQIAETLFLEFMDNPSQSEKDLLNTLVLDDYYYGHGLVR